MLAHQPCEVLPVTSGSVIPVVFVLHLMLLFCCYFWLLDAEAGRFTTLKTHFLQKKYLSEILLFMKEAFQNILYQTVNTYK